MSLDITDIDAVDIQVAMNGDDLTIESCLIGGGDFKLAGETLPLSREVEESKGAMRAVRGVLQRTLRDGLTALRAEHEQVVAENEIDGLPWEQLKTKPEGGLSPEEKEARTKIGFHESIIGLINSAVASALQNAEFRFEMKDRAARLGEAGQFSAVFTKQREGGEERENQDVIRALQIAQRILPLLKRAEEIKGATERSLENLKAEIAALEKSDPEEKLATQKGKLKGREIAVDKVKTAIAKFYSTEVFSTDTLEQAMQELMESLKMRGFTKKEVQQYLTFKEFRLLLNFKVSDLAATRAEAPMSRIVRSTPFGPETRMSPSLRIGLTVAGIIIFVVLPLLHSKDGRPSFLPSSQIDSASFSSSTSISPESIRTMKRLAEGHLGGNGPEAVAPIKQEKAAASAKASGGEPRKEVEK